LTPSRSKDPSVSFIEYPFARGGLTVCVTGGWVGVERAWEEDKLKARKKLENSYSPTRPVHALLDELLAIGITFF
jgi:hypothetical protein